MHGVPGHGWHFMHQLQPGGQGFDAGTEGGEINASGARTEEQKNSKNSIRIQELVRNKKTVRQ